MTATTFDLKTNKRQDRQMASLTQIELLLPELRSYAKTICVGHREDAEDLVQDAIERALRAEKRPNKLAELRPWIIRIIRNLYYDELRKRRVRREYSATEKRLLNDVSDGADVDRDVLIRLAYEKLTPASREILYLVDILEFKYADAAWVLNVPQGTIMSRVSRARAALLALVEGDEEPLESEELRSGGPLQRK
ncbi:MAG: RNA polymerase sigma factor [Pseudomonadota bacterium]